MRSEIGRAWRHALLRRCQGHRLPWHRFSRIKERFIPTVRNMHPYPEERFYASHTARVRQFKPLLEGRLQLNQ